MPAEYPLDLTSFLRAGLQRDVRLQRNIPGLQECKNMQPYGVGLAQVRPVTIPASSSLTVSWPYPQIFRGHTGIYLAYETLIYSITDESDWTPLQLYTYDAADPSTSKAITAGGAWHFAELGKCTLFMNQSCVVMSRYNLSTGKRYFFVYDDFIAHTGCFLDERGQGMFGCLESVETDPDWYSYWETLAGTADSTVYKQVDSSMTNVVWWSTIGGGDMSFLFEVPTDRDGFEAQMLRNEWGYSHMPWKGNVLAILPLGKGAVVYGDVGITALIPSSQPQPTYGQMDLADFGILERTAVCGDRRTHVFLDGQGNVWQVNAQFQLQKLGFGNLFKSAVNNEDNGPVMVSRNPIDRHFYFAYPEATNGDKCYVLNAAGMGRTEQQLTSTVFGLPTSYSGKTLGIANGEDADYEDQTFEVTTNTFDMGVKAIKTIESLQVDAGEVSNLQTCVYYRTDLSSDFTQTEWYTNHVDGSVFPTCAGTEFRIGLKGSLADASTTLSTLDRLVAFWQLIDRRNVRGPYARQASS